MAGVEIVPSKTLTSTSLNHMYFFFFYSCLVLTIPWSLNYLHSGGLPLASHQAVLLCEFPSLTWSPNT